MEETTITCSNCGHKIPLTEALTHELQEKLSAEMSDSLKQKEAELMEKEKGFTKKLELEKAKILDEAKKKAEQEVSTEIRSLKQESEERGEKLRLAEQKELEMLKKTRDLEEKARTMDLEIARKVEDERKKIEESAQSRTAEEFRTQLRTKDEQMDQMRKTIDDLKRKSEQGSMQIQGEIQEDDLRDALVAAFASDSINDVPQGVKGADLIHIVRSRSGIEAGTILWESKNTKSWSDEWLKKLKDDQAHAKADVAVIVTTVLPEGVKCFGLKDGVWVTEPMFFLPLANAIRHELLQMSQIKASLVGKDEKMEILYQYLTSIQFKNRVENIVHAFQGLKIELDKERRAMERIWSRREKEIERVMKNTVGMYGDFQGLIGTALPTIATLELPEGSFEGDEQGE